MTEGPVERRIPAVLALADGSLFSGISIGAEGFAVGEVVFNTAMTGYQEILTDPSYAEQIVTLTYPHIGNVGVNPDDQESSKAWVAGLIIRELSPIMSNWRAIQTLEPYLIAQNVVGIAGIDTRRLTRLIRTKGAQSGCIGVGLTPQEAIAHARAFPGLTGKDLAKKVSITQVQSWTENIYRFPEEHRATSHQNKQWHTVVYDFGVKRQILRLLVDRGCRVTVVPAETSATQVMALKPDGVVLSNGPGDPAACGYAIQSVRELLEKAVPLLGICLGFQLLALACGAKTIKMKFGHHGANHPVKELDGGRVYITSQNHGFAVDERSLPSNLRVTHVSLFDGTLQGIAHQHKPAFAFQGHPEASPGPQDISLLFDRFIALMERRTVDYLCQKEQI